MDKIMIEALAEKTKTGVLKWCAVEDINLPFAFDCLLSTGFFRVNFIPAFPVNESLYALEWHVSEFSTERSTHIMSRFNSEMADGHFKDDSIKCLYAMVHALMAPTDSDIKEFERNSTLDSARIALGLPI